MNNFKIFSERLSYKEASLYLKFFPRPLEDVFSVHLGGTLTAASFRALTSVQKFSGIMAWYCLDKTTDLTPKIHLAFQAMSDFTYPGGEAEAQALEPYPGNLLIPNELLHEDLRSIPDHEQFLRNHVDNKPTSDNTLSDVDVKKFTMHYIQNPILGKYQKYRHGYFDNSTGKEDYLTGFLNQGAVEYVRYYFGFHSHAVPNHIRIILVPVDKDGKNLTSTTTRTEPHLVQKSVPPPPI